VSLVEHPGNKDATFKSSSNIYYNLDLKNNFTTQQAGHVSCRILSMDDKVLSLTSIAVSLQGKTSKQVKMNMPSQSSGFYKAQFIINTQDYDDTVRRVFGVDINDIHSPHPKPSSFEEFWTAARQDLDKVDPRFKMIEKPELSRGNDQVYLIEMQSLGNLTVRGWLTLPKDRKKNEKFPVYLALPGYGADQKPFHDMPDFAAIALNVRGQGNSNDVLNIGREEFLTYNILDKNKYILRGAIMDCVRMVDFIFSRPEFDSKSIYSNGGSMGGYFSLILASLDHRITVCTAGNPAFSDWRTLVDHNDFPMGAIQRYAKENALSLNRILDNLDYFDLKNFVGDIKCKTLVGIGLLDNLAPPHTEMPAYNNIQANKKIFIFPNLGHQVGDTFGSYTGKMVYDNFGIF
jgi:cephalosporin-C deacetylase-like acetyl esterase